MRPILNDDDAFQRVNVPLDYSKVIVNPDDPFNSSPDPFIKRYNGKIYYDPWEGIDYRPNPWLKMNRAVERAIWSYATSSQTVPTVLPTFLDSGYVYTVPSDAPAFAAIPHKASLGGQESYVRVTALGAPTTYFVAQDATPDPVTGTPARVNKDKKIAQTWGGVTGFMRAAGENFKDMLAESHRERLTGLLTNGLEDGILNGDGSGNNMEGILTQQGTTNNVDKNSSAVTLADIQNALRMAWNAGGDLESFGFAITDYITYDYIKNLLMEYLGYVNVDNYDLPWGLKTYSVQGVPFIRSRKMPTTANVKKVVFIDRRYTYIAVLTDVTTELYGKVKDQQDFAIKFYGQPICRAPEFQAVISEIA